MFCPYCGHNNSRVIDSRDAGDGIRRRRECIRCGLRYTTYERVQTTALHVVKRDGRREEFNRDKLLNSIRLACAKRPLATGTIDRLVNDVEERLQKLGRAEIPSFTIGEMVVQKLRNVDRVSYIRFASVYHDFTDLETFREEVDAILTPPETLSRLPENQPALFKMEDALPEIQHRPPPPPTKSE
ncbi:transcriptional regulator NrdR [Dehalococcoidia bacterium]|nr:transcriptional regulator NrdR [Dehalococcoidia bacterium]